MSSIVSPRIHSSTQEGLSGGNEKSDAFHIPSLDGVRALAFLIVFVSHAGLKDLVPGGLGVTIFFVLSGYLITTLLRLELQKTGRVDLRAFYLRRMFRIFPLLYITIIAAVLLNLTGQLGGLLTLRALISQLVHWSNYYLIAHGPGSVIAGTIVLWSLSVEEHFYLVFPVIFHFLNKKLTAVAQGWILGSLCVGCLLWRLVLIVFLHAPEVRTELGTDTRFDSLLLGCLMAIVANPAIDDCKWMTLRRVKRAAMLALPILLFTLIFRNVAFRYTWRFSLQSVSLLPLFVYAIRVRGSVAYRILNSRWMAQLGTLSYGLYLIHGIILEWFTEHLQSSKLIVGLATFVVALLLAKALQLGVERPFLTLRKSFAHIRT